MKKNFKYIGVHFNRMNKSFHRLRVVSNFGETNEGEKYSHKRVTRRAFDILAFSEKMAKRQRCNLYFQNQKTNKTKHTV